jgi:hypothetical protein
MEQSHNVKELKGVAWATSEDLLPAACRLSSFCWQSARVHSAAATIHITLRATVELPAC